MASWRRRTGRPLEVDRAEPLGAQAHDLVVVDRVEGVRAVQDRRHVAGQVGRPWAVPTTRGEMRRAATMTLGSVASTAASAKAPRTTRRLARTASSSSRPWPAHSSIRWASTSESVTEVKTVAPGLELAPAARPVVLDDAVVDDGDVARAVEVRVGVDRLGGAVGGPAGVADAREEARRGAARTRRAGPRPTRCPAAVRARQVSPGAHEGHAGRVVAAVLQALPGPRAGSRECRRIRRPR